MAEESEGGFELRNTLEERDTQEAGDTIHPGSGGYPYVVKIFWGTPKDTQEAGDTRMWWSNTQEAGSTRIGEDI